MWIVPVGVLDSVPRSADQFSVLRNLILAFALFLGAAALAPSDAQAQYRNFTFGFEAGYMGMTDGTRQKPHTIGFGLFGGWKTSDHWWFTHKALLGFSGQLDNAPNTIVNLHVVPIMARYYIKTDSVRPFVGVSNAFQFTFNGTSSLPGAMWGPGGAAGIEFKLRRDLFLGFEGNAFYMIVFDGENAGVFTANAQLIFFL